MNLLIIFKNVLGRKDVKPEFGVEVFGVCVDEHTLSAEETGADHYIKVSR